MPLTSIAAWGLGPTEVYITGFFDRVFVAVAKTLFWSKPLADFNKQLVEIEEAKNEGLIRPTLILAPLLNNGEKTDICLKLGEKAATGEQVPQWIGITNP